ncbi:MAG TPA: hypothetical protein DDX71_07400 [Ruminococcus sp.]|nr:hypothetical protein [Ruminococcus sp.]
MLGSDYRELIVPKLDNHGKLIGILAGGGILTLASIILAIVSGRFLLLILSLALGAGTFYLSYNNRIEYEYVISGDQLDITKILSQSRRKPLLTVSLDKFTAFGKLTEAPPVSDSQTLVLACSAQDTACYYADFDHPEYGQTRLLLTPNEDILLYLEKHLPRSIGFRILK